MKKMILVATNLLMLTTLPAYAEWSKTFDVEYVLGDGDNRVSARQAALEQIKVKATNDAGTYVQGTTTLQANGNLTEEVRMVSASLVKITSSNESLSINSAGQAVLKVNATASLDESELQRRIDAMQQDKEKARQVKVLEAENKSLRRDYEQIRLALSKKTNQARTAELLTRQDFTLKRIEENGRTISQVFERGTLLQLALHNTDAFENAKRDIDDNFYAPLLQIPISAEVKSVEQDGKAYVALVLVGWQADIGNARKFLRSYLTVTDYSKAIIADEYGNANGKGPSLLTGRIYNYLAMKGVDLEISLAGKRVMLPMFYRDNAFMDGCMHDHARGGGSKYLCLASQDKGDPDIKGMGYGFSNPVRIPLSREEAERATTVEAKWVVVH